MNERELQQLLQTPPDEEAWTPDDGFMRTLEAGMDQVDAQPLAAKDPWRSWRRATIAATAIAAAVLVALVVDVSVTERERETAPPVGEPRQALTVHPATPETSGAPPAAGQQAAAKSEQAEGAEAPAGDGKEAAAGQQGAQVAAGEKTAAAGQPAAEGTDDGAEGDEGGDEAESEGQAGEQLAMATKKKTTRKRPRRRSTKKDHAKSDRTAKADKPPKATSPPPKKENANKANALLAALNKKKKDDDGGGGGGSGLPKRLSSASVRSTLRGARGRFKNCGRLASDAAGKTLKVQIVIKGSGSVADARVVEAAGTSGAVQACVVRALKRMAFKKFGDDQMTVNTPVKL